MKNYGQMEVIKNYSCKIKPSFSGPHPAHFSSDWISPSTSSYFPQERLPFPTDSSPTPADRPNAQTPPPPAAAARCHTEPTLAVADNSSC